MTDQIKNFLKYMNFVSSDDPKKLLLKFRDDEILKPEFVVNMDWDNRLTMIDQFIENNILIHGKFEVISNLKTVYGKAPTIFYQEKGIQLNYGATDFLELMSNTKVWKDKTKKSEFSNLNLHSLRIKILEKFNQWNVKDFSSAGYNVFPPELINILNKLEMILAGDLKNSIGSYLGEPNIPVDFDF